ncbi:MAG: IclR family transcriptional regulator [Alphaproteobacteria bacterium]
MRQPNSLERMLAILGMFSEDRLEWTPDQLMERLGYSRPTLYRYLKILKEQGMLASLPNAGYILGPKVVEMDYLLRRSDPLVLEGAGLLRELAQRHPCTAFLVRWYRDRVLCVHSETSAPDPKSSYPRGRPMPLGRGAVARAILAHLPRRQLMPILERNRAEFGIADGGADLRAVLDRLRQVRRTGVAVARGEITPGAVGIATPVYDAGQSPIACICVTIAERRAPEPVVARIADEVRAAGRGLTAALARHRAREPA